MSEIQEPMPGVIIRPLVRRTDHRGWLAELFRHDELADELHPTMAYISCTEPGISRGPHEHVDQTDGFVFFDGDYELHLWDNRPGGDPSLYVEKVGEKNPVWVSVPPGVVHGYRCVGDRPALVLNFPNRLYAGPGKSEPVDEIRHESDPNSPFKIS